MRLCLLVCAVFLLSAVLLPGAAPRQAPASVAQGAVIGPAVEIHPPPENHRFPLDETYVYQADWRLWNAGLVTLTINATTGPQMRVSGTATSSGVVSVLYPVRDRFQAVFDRRTFCSESIAKHTEEGFRARDTLINFNYQRAVSVLDETNLKTSQTKHQEKAIPACVTDVLSALYYARSLPLVPDATYGFPLNDGGDTVNVKVRVEAREQVKVPAGTYKTIRISPEAAQGLLKDKGKIWVWYSDDDQRIPVQMRSRMFWGTLTFRLVRIDKK